MTGLARCNLCIRHARAEGLGLGAARLRRCCQTRRAIPGTPGPQRLLRPLSASTPLRVSASPRLRPHAHTFPQTRVPHACTGGHAASPSHAHAQVIYCQDGQNKMDAGTSWLNADWNLGRAASLLQAEGKVRPSLMVLIANSGSFRRIEYGDNAVGRRYVDWMCDDLKPLVDRTFPTLRDPRHTFALGSSMGGSISYLATLWRPEVFGNACCLSPMFEPQTIATVAAAGAGGGGIYRSSPQHQQQRIYIDNGGSTPDKQVRVSRRTFTFLRAAACG